LAGIKSGISDLAESQTERLKLQSLREEVLAEQMMSPTTQARAKLALMEHHLARLFDVLSSTKILYLSRLKVDTFESIQKMSAVVGKDI
jgi:hypothetical protein